MSSFTEAGSGDVRDALFAMAAKWPDTSPSTMLSFPAVMVARRVVAFVVDRAIVILRMRPDELAALERGFSAGPFIGQGGPVSSWVQIPISDPPDLAPLEPFIARAFDRARTEGQRT